jgi:predicted phosphoribosyltransferase
MFADREDAGRRLAALLDERGVEVDAVLAIPRGGLPVGRVVADRLDVPLDVIAAKKLGALGNPELAIGAATGDGTVWLNDELVAHLGVSDDHLDAEREQAIETAREKTETYRAGRPPLDVEGKRVVVVDDGVAAGATTRVCLDAVRALGAARVVLAVPVGPRETLDELASVADAVVCAETPTFFSAVGQDFSQVGDDEAMSYLDR